MLVTDCRLCSLHGTYSHALTDDCLKDLEQLLHDEEVSRTAESRHASVKTRKTSKNAIVA